MTPKEIRASLTMLNENYSVRELAAQLAEIKEVLQGIAATLGDPTRRAHASIPEETNLRSNH